MDFNSMGKKIKEGFIGQKMITIPPNIKAEISENILIKDFYLTAIGYYPHASYHDRKRKYGSEEYILLYCTEGFGDIELGNEMFKLIPHSFVIIPPYVPHHYRSSLEDPWTIYWAHISGTKAHAFYERYIQLIEHRIGNIPLNEGRLKKLIRLMNILEDGFEQKNLEYINLTFAQLLMGMIYRTEINAATNKADAISRSIDFLNRNISKNLKVEVLAIQQNLSVSRYSELFKSKTGYSPMKYFNKLKIQKSCQYLYFTDLNIQEICTKVGFEDPYYFSRSFKKLMGMPPSKYKLNYRTSKLTK